MPDITIQPALAGTLANAIIDSLNGGTVKFYTGAQPADPSAAVTDQVLLGTLTLGSPAGTQTGGLITFGAIGEDASADANGTATWTRWRSSDGTARIDMAVGNAASAKPVKMNTTTVAQGGALQITSATFLVG